MRINVTYFGLLAEITGCTSEQFNEPMETIHELQQVLLAKYPDFEKHDLRMAQDQEIVASEEILTGKEIAVLPPFAGG